MSLLTLFASAAAPAPAFILDQLFIDGRTGAAFAFDDLSYLTTDGSTPVTAVDDPIGEMVSRWTGREYPVTASGTARPLYKLDANDRPYGYFDAVDDELSRLADDLFNGSTDATMVIALERRSITGVRVMAAHRTASYTHPQFFSNATTMYGYWNQATGESSIGRAFGNGIAYVVTMTRRGNVFTLRVNGVEVGTQTVTMSSPATPGGLHIGGYAGANLSDINLYAIAGISGDLSADEMAILEGWAADRIGVTL